VPAPLARRSCYENQLDRTALFCGPRLGQDHHDVIVVDGSARSSSIFDSLTLLTVGVTLTSACSPWASVRWPSKPPAAWRSDQLLQRAYPLYPVNPKAANVTANAKCPAAPKPIATMPGVWPRPCAPTVRLGEPCDPGRGHQHLRLLCGDEIALIEQRTALVNQLQAALADYYPLALESFED